MSEKSSEKGSEKASDKKETGTESGHPDAIALLQADHRKVERLFKQYEKAGTNDEKMQIAKQVCTELIVHSRLEEEIFYPSCRENHVEARVLDEAQVEHDGVKLLIGEILQRQPDSPYYDARVSVLSEYVKHHVGEEENSSDGIFAKARAAKLDMNALGQRLQARKQELMEEHRSLGSMPLELRSLELRFIYPPQQEISTMPRQYEQERDEYGRFISDDDYRNRGRSHSYSNERARDEYGRFARDDDDDYRQGHRYYQSNERDRDEYGRFVSDYDRSRGYSGRSYRDDDEDDDYRSSSRGSSGRERDESGRFLSDDDERSMRGTSRSRGHGGWFGDPEGHSRAAHERYQGRGSSYYERGRDDDDYGSRGGRGHGGWFGDREGHARAAEEGWRHRESSGSSRYDDDRGRSGSTNDGRGWYGDTRGHAEAARRGWQNRR